MSRAHVVALAVALAGCGPIYVGDLPGAAASLELRAIEDGLGAVPRPTVSLGQTVQVVLVVANVGAREATSVAPVLFIRNHEGALVAPIRVSPTDTVTSIPGRTTRQLRFAVEIPRAAPTGIWTLSAQVKANEGSTLEAPAPMRRTWVVQQPAALRLTGLTTTVGNTSLGYTSANPGCPAEIKVGFRNEGQATAALREVALVFEGAEPPLGVMQIALVPGPQLAGGVDGQATFRVIVPERIPGGTRYVTGVRLMAIDANSELAVPAALAGVDPVSIVASGSRFLVMGMPPRLEVQSGQTGIEIPARVVYEPGPGSPPMIDRVAISLHLTRGDWAVRPAPTNPTGLRACDPAPCDGVPVSFTVDAPALIEPGPVGVILTVEGLDTAGGQTDVFICGRSDPELSTKIEVLR